MHIIFIYNKPAGTTYYVKNVVKNSWICYNELVYGKRKSKTNAVTCFGNDWR